MGNGSSKNSPSYAYFFDNVWLETLEVGRVLGRGAFSTVYAVTVINSKHGSKGGSSGKSGKQHGKSRAYALKVMSKRRLVDGGSVTNVMEERKIATTISAPLVMSPHACWQTDSHIFMLHDVMHGGDLSFPLLPPTKGRNGRIDENRVKFYAFQTLLALQYLHSQGIVHCDIKPENLLLDKNGNCHITDFNVAICLPEGEVIRESRGTEPYMAPEVLDSTKDFGPKADVWSLGIACYEMLTGYLPWHKMTDEQRQQRVTAARVSFPDKLTVNGKKLIDGKFKEFLAKCFRHTDERYSVEEALNDPLFAEYSRDKCFNKLAIPPFKPNRKPNLDPFCDAAVLFEQRAAEAEITPREQRMFSGWDYTHASLPDTIPRVADACRENSVGTQEEGSGLYLSSSAPNVAKSLFMEIDDPSPKTHTAGPVLRATHPALHRCCSVAASFKVTSSDESDTNDHGNGDGDTVEDSRAGNEAACIRGDGDASNGEQVITEDEGVMSDGDDDDDRDDDGDADGDGDGGDDNDDDNDDELNTNGENGDGGGGDADGDSDGDGDGGGAGGGDSNNHNDTPEESESHGNGNGDGEDVCGAKRDGLEGGGVVNVGGWERGVKTVRLEVAAHDNDTPRSPTLPCRQE